MDNPEGGVQAVEPTAPAEPTVEPTVEPAASTVEPQPAYTPSVEPEAQPATSDFDGLTEDQKQDLYNLSLERRGAAASPDDGDWEQDQARKTASILLPAFKEMFAPMQQDQGMRSLNEGLNEHEVAAMAEVVKENKASGEMLAGIAANPATKALFQNAARFKAWQTFNKPTMNGEPPGISQSEPDGADAAGDKAIATALKLSGEPFDKAAVEKVKAAGALLAAGDAHDRRFG